MTVFKTFWKIVNKYKGTIILYTVMLIGFGAINMNSGDVNMTFTDTKPDIVIVNHDVNIGLTENLIDYLKDNANVKVFSSEEEINDALFYRDISYVIYIQEGYRRNVLNGENPSIDIKTNGTYDSSLTEMMLERYVKTQNTFRKLYDDEKTIIKNINDSLSKKSEMIINSKLDAGEMSNISFYYSFASYSIMAVVIYIVCLVLGSFHKEYVNKRIIISEMDYKKHNWLLLISSFGYGLLVWILYNLIGVMILGKTVFTLNGLWYVINSFVFTLCSLTMALFISSLVSNKNAIAGVVNVVALGSAFLCGAFIPMSMLPDGVLKFAHVLPSYWYIKSNELLKTMEIFDLTNLKPILLNLGMILLFSVIFIILNNYVTRKKRSI